MPSAKPEHEYFLLARVPVSFSTTVPNGLQLCWLSGGSHYENHLACKYRQRENEWLLHKIRPPRLMTGVCIYCACQVFAHSHKVDCSLWMKAGTHGEQTLDAECGRVFRSSQCCSDAYKLKKIGSVRNTQFGGGGIPYGSVNTIIWNVLRDSPSQLN
jgi:hypothetical protein